MEEEFRILRQMDKLTEQLNRRHQERQANLNNIHDMKLLDTEQTEGTDYFSRVFNQNVCDIEQQIMELEPGDTTTLALNFSQIENKIQELQRYLSTSVYFLPNYVVQQRQAIITNLVNRVENVKSNLMPKKKFGFKNRLAPKNYNGNGLANGNCLNHFGLMSGAVKQLTVMGSTYTNLNNKEIQVDMVDSNKVADQHNIGIGDKNEIQFVFEKDGVERYIDEKNLEDRSNGDDNKKGINDTKSSVKSASLFEWTIYNKTGKVIMLKGDEVNCKDITVSKIDNCLIEIYGHPGSLQLNDITNSTIICGPISRSVFAAGCINCTFVFACQQMRLHTSKNCDIYLHVTCRGIIEDCIRIAIAPFKFNYSDLHIDFIKAGLSDTDNNWKDIADFNWLSPDIPSPNWSILPENDRILNWNAFLQNIRNRLK